jgi:hypothetical protein
MIVDKKRNLARGFADVHTPSSEADELLMNFYSKRDDIARRIREYEEQLSNTPKSKKGLRKHLVEGLKAQNQKMYRLKEKQKHMASRDGLLVQRLKKFVDPEIFLEQARRAKLESDFILENVGISDEELLEGGE